MRALALMLWVVFLAGCASLAGNAHYTYTRSGADCTIRIDSGRNVAGPATATITGCDLVIGAGGLTQGESRVPQIDGLLQTVMQGLLLQRLGLPVPNAPPTAAPIVIPPKLGDSIPTTTQSPAAMVGAEESQQ